MEELVQAHWWRERSEEHVQLVLVVVCGVVGNSGSGSRNKIVLVPLPVYAFVQYAEGSEFRAKHVYRKMFEMHGKEETQPAVVDRSVALQSYTSWVLTYHSIP